MSRYINIIAINICIIIPCETVSILSPSGKGNKTELDCKGGHFLSSYVCVPIGYLKGEVPESPTIVNTRLEINNIREVNNKKISA